MKAHIVEDHNVGNARRRFLEEGVVEDLLRQPISELCNSVARIRPDIEAPVHHVLLHRFSASVISDFALIDERTSKLRECFYKSGLGLRRGELQRSLPEPVGELLSTEAWKRRIE